MAGLILRAVLWGIAGGILTPMVLLLLIQGARGAGICNDDNGCGLETTLLWIFSMPAGAVIFALVTLVRGWRRLG